MEVRQANHSTVSDKPLFDPKQWLQVDTHFCWVLEGHKISKRGWLLSTPLPNALLEDFYVSVYFWPLPDTGYCVVQLKHLQMSPFHGFNTNTRCWFFTFPSVIYISAIIGYFLCLPSQRPWLFDWNEGGKCKRRQKGLKSTKTHWGETTEELREADPNTFPSGVYE